MTGDSVGDIQCDFRNVHLRGARKFPRTCLGWQGLSKQGTRKGGWPLGPRSLPASAHPAGTRVRGSHFAPTEN